MTPGRTTFEVATEDDGLRLDQVIPKHVTGLSRRKARAVIDLGGVFVDKARVKVAGRIVRPGQVIEVNIGGALERSMRSAAAVGGGAAGGGAVGGGAVGGGAVGGGAAGGDAVGGGAVGRGAAGGGAVGRGAPSFVPRIVHSDAHVIVVDKPAGLVSAPTPESDRGDLLDQLKRQFGEVYLVHRLDMPTSGLLVFARTRDANRKLGELFKVHDVEREYRAVVVGAVAAQTIDRDIARRRAVTHVEPVETFATATLLKARLETGRTHQIRVHLAGIGHPVVGDRTHGGEAERAFLPRPPRLALHAMILGFVHPATGERRRWESTLPDELASWIDRLRPPRTSTP